MEDLAVQRETIDAAVRAAEAALAGGDLARAAAEVARGRRAGPA
jgi:hypothetical protein